MAFDAMLNQVGAVGWLFAAALALGLAALLTTTWRGRMEGGLLLLALALTALWAGAAAVQALWQVVPIQLLRGLEALRALGWLWFLLALRARLPGGRQGPWVWLRALAVLAALLLLLPLDAWRDALGLGHLDLRLLLHLLLAVLGLALVEQLYRGTPWPHRWGIKFLCLGLGGLFAFDFFFYADALLFDRIDFGLWLARGPVTALVIPLLAVSVARNPQWSFDLAVSRSLVFHSTALAAAGLYLLFMALAGYWIRYWGGEWSALFQPLFLFGAGLLLLILLFSGQLRARLKLFVNRHFYSYRYDYRSEWLHLISVLSGQALQATLPERVIFALGELVESPGGCIWLRDEGGVCRFQRCFNFPEAAVVRDYVADDLCAALGRGTGVIDLERGPLDDSGAGPVTLPDWLTASQRLWLLVPLPHEDRVLGFVLLARPRAPQSLEWESLELLGTVARQAASYLAMEAALRALAEAQQFRGFNRLAAFVVHDLKNLVAQLSLVLRNADRHRGNPQFVDDALRTVGDAVEKMNRLLASLRAAAPAGAASRVALVPLLQRLTRDLANRSPVPRLDVDPAVADGGPMVMAEPDRLTAVLANVIHNAQDATPRDGTVEVHLGADPNWVRITVVDTGCGMDEAFVRERLFRPFDSTKGLAGMGIGAYECREYVLGLGGRLEVDSAPGAGTRFSLILPRA